MIYLVFCNLRIYQSQQVFLKNLPPNSSLIEEIMDRVKGFLISKALLKGDSSTTSRPLRHLRGESVSVRLHFVCHYFCFIGLKFELLPYKSLFRRTRMEKWTYKGDPPQKKYFFPHFSFSMRVTFCAIIWTSLKASTKPIWNMEKSMASLWYISNFKFKSLVYMIKFGLLNTGKNKWELGMKQIVLKYKELRARYKEWDYCQDTKK